MYLTTLQPDLLIMNLIGQYVKYTMLDIFNSHTMLYALFFGGTEAVPKLSPTLVFSLLETICKLHFLSFHNRFWSRRFQMIDSSVLQQYYKEKCVIPHPQIFFGLFLLSDSNEILYETSLFEHEDKICMMGSISPLSKFLEFSFIIRFR